MCGIYGVYSYATSVPIERGEMRRVSDRLAPRGPDGEGEWYSPEGRIALGHRRLAIIDVSGGIQPMHSADGSITLVYNGETYNYQALRDELIAKEKAKSEAEKALLAPVDGGAVRTGERRRRRTEAAAQERVPLR